MSLEDARQYIQKAHEDESFRKSVMEAPSQAERIKRIKDAGFDFSAEEFAQAKIDYGETDKAKLTDEQLDAISGGKIALVPVYRDSNGQLNVPAGVGAGTGYPHYADHPNGLGQLVAYATPEDLQKHKGPGGLEKILEAAEHGLEAGAEVAEVVE